MASHDQPLPDVPARRPRRLRRHGDPRTVTLHLASVTPIYGGGAVAREVDRDTPIRVPGVRGQLRFFWRALFPPGKRDELAGRERALFGGVFGEEVMRSRVDVWVTDVEPREEPARDNVGYRTPGAYALWPARGTNDGVEPAERWSPGVRFCLHVRAPGEVLDTEIVPALRAWLWFGGVGARTRRGCGSLTVIEDAAQWLPGKLAWGELDRLLGARGALDPGSGGALCDMPSLHGAALHHGAPASGKGEPAMTAWLQALDWLRDFRQGARKSEAEPEQDFARRKIQKEPRDRPGESNWPEADKVRRLCEQLGRGRRWTHPPVHDGDPAWPRAGFGLPIVGQFQGKGPNGERYTEPPSFELRWVDKDGNQRERLASPVIVKALAMADGRFAPVALWLHRAHPTGGQVVLCMERPGPGARKEPIRESLAPFDKRVGEGESPRYTALQGKDSLRQAFCDWLVERRNLTPLQRSKP